MRTIIILHFRITQNIINQIHRFLTLTPTHTHSQSATRPNPKFPTLGSPFVAHPHRPRIPRRDPVHVHLHRDDLEEDHLHGADGEQHDEQGKVGRRPAAVGGLMLMMMMMMLRSRPHVEDGRRLGEPPPAHGVSRTLVGFRLRCVGRCRCWFVVGRDGTL